MGSLGLFMVTVVAQTCHIFAQTGASPTVQERGGVLLPEAGELQRSWAKSKDMHPTKTRARGAGSAAPQEVAVTFSASRVCAQEHPLYTVKCSGLVLWLQEPSESAGAPPGSGVAPWHLSSFRMGGPVWFPRGGKAGGGCWLWSPFEAIAAVSWPPHECPKHMAPPHPHSRGRGRRQRKGGLPIS